MKKYWFLLVVLILTSCDYFSDDNDEFINAYKKILIVREQYKADSLKWKADKEIKKIYEEYGYTEQSFRDKFFELATEDSRKFYELLDSIRYEVRQELNRIREEKKSKNSPDKETKKSNKSAKDLDKNED